MRMSLARSDVLPLLEEMNIVIRDDHFVYTGGDHGKVYVNKDALYPNTGVTSALCGLMAEDFRDSECQVVLGPAQGGIILAQYTAEHLCALRRQDVLAVFADKEGDEFVLKRGYDALVAGKRVLVVEDVMNKGGSVQKVVLLARSLGAEIVGVAALWNRGKVTAEQLGVPVLKTLVDMAFDRWPEAECPLCRDCIPVNTKIGKGREFMARRIS